MILSGMSQPFARLGSGCVGALRWFSSSVSGEKTFPQIPSFKHTPQPYSGPSAAEVLELRKKYLSPCELLKTLVRNLRLGLFALTVSLS